MEFDFQESKPSVEIDFQPEEKPKSKRKAGALDQAAGVAMSAADFLGIIPPAITGVPLGIGDVFLNERPPKQILESTEQAIGDYNLANKIPSADFYRQTEGYKYSPITKVMELLGEGQKAFGKGVAATSEFLGASPEKAEQIGAAGEIGTMVLPLGLRRGTPKPGSDRAYFDVQDKKPTRQEIAESNRNKADYGFVEEPVAPRTMDPSVAGQMELPMPDQNIRSPYNLTPEQIARAEQELNPPTEQRVTGQGELFTDERALTPDEAMNRKFPLEEATTGARDRIIGPEAERLQMDTPARVGEMEARVGPPEQALGGQGDQAALPFETRLSDLGSVGLERQRRLAELAKEQPIPYEAPRRPIGPKSQRGVIDPDLLTLGVSRLLREKGPRETIKKFVGTFSPDSIRKALENTRDPKSRETLVWMSPDDFHSLADDRKDHRFNKEISGDLRKSIREGLGTRTGLTDIPALVTDSDGKVIEHNGRHRMDVFKEQGIDLVPVTLRHGRHRWGESDISERPKLIRAQDDARDPSFSIETPALLRDQMKQEDILSKHRPMSRQTGAVNFFGGKTKDSVAKKGIVRTMQDMKTMFTFDKRPLAKMLEEERITPENMTDLAGKGTDALTRADRLLQQGMTNAAIDRQLAILSANKGPVGKVIKWVIDHQNVINQRAKLRIEEAIEVGLKPWKALKKSNEKSLRQALTTWQDNIGKIPLREQDFANVRQWEVYKALSDTMKDLHERVNDARARANLKPIAAIENYFPAIREGDYWVHVLDSKGELKWSSAYSSVREAQAAHKLLQKEFGKEFTVKQPAIQKKGEYDLSSFAAFEETLRAMTKDDPIKNAIQARYAELVGKRGFGKTGIMRKNIGGALGFEAGAKGIKNSEHVLEAYFKRGESYIANLERAQLQKQIGEVPAALWEKAPIAKKYIDDYLQKARGAQLDALPMIRQLSEAISTEILGQGRQAPRKFIQNTASIASLFWLMTPKFFLSQLAQPMNAMAKLVDLYGLGDSVKNPAHAFFDGYAQALSPDVIGKEAQQWAKKNGYLESTIVSLLELKLQDLKGEKWRLIDDAARFTMGKMEGSLVRIPVFHMFESALRKQVPDKKERFEMAANLMDNYMVHYDRESGPLMYEKGGLLGEVTRPLKTYAHNYWGQFFEYAQTAKDTGSVKPLATMLGTQTLVGGMKGVILAAEATAIITLLNTMFGTDIPTPEELLLESGASDTLVYGGYSTMLDADVSSSLSSPGMPQMFSFPPAEFAAKAVADSWNYLTKKIKGTDTDQDAMKAMMAVSPTAMRGWIEALYSEPGMPIPKPTDKMKGNFPAPEEGSWAEFTRFGLNLKTLDEARTDAIVRVTKQLLQRDAQQKLSALDAIADRVSNNQELTPELINKFIQEGGDPANLSSNIASRLRDRQITFTDREQSKTVTPNQVNRLNTLRKFLDDQFEESVEKKDPREPSDFKKMSGNETTPFDPWRGNLDYDSGKEKIMKEQRRTSRAMDLNTIEAQGRRLFPGDRKKQLDYIRYVLETRMDQKEELRNFKGNIEKRRQQNNYTEM